MPPKIIHLCWFSKDPYPLEIKICLASWKRVLPDYKVRVWTYEDAKAIVVNNRPGVIGQEMGICGRCSPFLCCI